MSVAPVEARQAVLNHSNRCDKCHSRAYVLVVLASSPSLPEAGELLFCAHDFRKHEDAISPYASLIIDERWQLSEHVRDDGHVN